MLNKLVLDQESNPCTDGTAVCGDNTVCVLVEDDLYDVSIKNIVYTCKIYLPIFVFAV